MTLSDYTQFSISILSNLPKCLTFSVTITIPCSTEVHPINKSESSMRIPSLLNIAFCLANSCKQPDIGTTSILLQKSRTISIFLSLCMLHSAPYKSSATVISDIQQLLHPFRKIISAIFFLPRMKYTQILLSNRYFIIRVSKDYLLISSHCLSPI